MCQSMCIFWTTGTEVFCVCFHKDLPDKRASVQLDIFLTVWDSEQWPGTAFMDRFWTCFFLPSSFFPFFPEFQVNGLMVHGLQVYQPLKALYSTGHILTHTFTHWWWRLPCKRKPPVCFSYVHRSDWTSREMLLYRKYSRRLHHPQKICSRSLAS